MAMRRAWSGALATGAGCGAAAALVWAATVVALRPIPADASSAVLVTLLAMVGAVAVNRDRGVGTLRASLCAGAVAALLIVVAVAALSTFGPPSLIPDLAPAALTPADDLAQSRHEIQDPYVAVLALGVLIASALAVAVAATRPRRPATG